MFGTTIAWLFSLAIGLLLTRVALKNPNLDDKQRKSGFILGGVAVLFLLLISFFSFMNFDWAQVYESPPMVSGQEFNPNGGTWGLVKGQISEDSELAEKERGYVAYVRYNSSIQRNRRVHDTYGFRKIAA